MKNEIEHRHILFLSCDGFRKIFFLCVDLSANVFDSQYKKKRLFYIFSSFCFCSLFQKQKLKGAKCCLPSKDSLDYLLSLFKEWFQL